MVDTGFPCSANNDARILILGSMPSQKSLAVDQYYAHPRNAFWWIMAELFDFNAGMDYTERLRLLCNNRVALWDVAQACVRPGSMDHAIKIESVVANDFELFFKKHLFIRAIFFNGRKAEDLYRKLVKPSLSVEFQQIPTQLLSSTSPANAAMSRAQKLAAWETITHALEIS